MTSPAQISQTKHVLSPETSNFIKLAEAHIVVDKTHAISEFLNGGLEPIHLLLRPRRSGKTTLLRMFEALFKRTNPAHEEMRKQLFKKNHLVITQSPQFDSEFGRYPILYIDLSNLIGDNMDDLREQFAELVYDIARDVQTDGYFRYSQDLSEVYQTFLRNVLQRQLPPTQLPRALYHLTNVVAQLTKRRAIVLIDEYDTPTPHSVQHGYFPEADDFFRGIFSSLLKGNQHIRGALIVGFLRVSKADWLSGVNNIMIFPADVKMYSKACMFTEDETRKLYDQEAALGDKEALPFSFEDLKEWYNGYYAYDGARLYNPWSVGNAFVHKKLDSYWVQSGYDDLVRQRIDHFLDTDGQFREQFAKLVDNNDTMIEIENEMSYDSATNMSPTQLWTLTYHAGYLTKTENEAGIHRGDDRTTEIIARLPNFEISNVFHQWLQNHIDGAGIKT